MPHKRLNRHQAGHVPLRVQHALCCSQAIEIPLLHGYNGRTFHSVVIDMMNHAYCNSMSTRTLSLYRRAHAVRSFTDSELIHKHHYTPVFCSTQVSYIYIDHLSAVGLVIY